MTTTDVPMADLADAIDESLAMREAWAALASDDSPHASQMYERADGWNRALRKAVNMPENAQREAVAQW